jgi:glycosyltransferase 2 family protein
VRLFVSTVEGTSAVMSRKLWTWARPLGAAAVLAVLVWRMGTGPFLAGVRTVDGRALAAGALIAVLTTVCCAWRWRIVARGLGVDLPLGVAVAAYYRSVFLNTVLPGGVVGDVHRGVSHGRDIDDVGLALRAVVCERTAGQVVQGVLTVIALLVLPSPVRSSMPVVVAGVAALAVGLVLLGRALPRGGSSRWARALRAARTATRDGLLARSAWPGIVLASGIVVAGHAATFLIAARTAGSTVSVARMLPLALLVLLAMVLPSVAGWGPREGGAAWVFGAAGIGAAQGVATAVVYGVMVLVASLPGAGVLVVTWLQGRTGRAEPVVALPHWQITAAAGQDGAERG